MGIRDMLKTVLSGLLTLCLVLTLVPAAALADDDGAAQSGDQPATLKDLSGATVSGLEASYVYTGSAIEPAVALELDGETVPESAYQLSYTANTGVGTAAVTATGLEDQGYTGMVTAEFAITQKSIAAEAISGVSASYAYTGAAIKPAPSLTVDGITLKLGTDFTVSYANNTKLGTATMTITGTGNYTDTLLKTFTIAKRKLTAKSVTITKLKTEYTYTGKKIKPTPVLKYNGKKLVKGTDYKLTYKTNKKPGKAYVCVQFKGNYTGSFSKKFKIVLAQPKLKSLTNVGGAIIVKWKKRSEVGGYKIRYATNKKMKSPYTVKVKGASVKSVTFKGLDLGKTYYVQVRAYKGSALGPWSKAKKLRLSKLSRTDLTSLIDTCNGGLTLRTFNSTYDLNSTAAGQELVSYLKKLQKSYKVSLIMMDLKTGEGISSKGHRSMYSASCLKGPYVASLCKWKPSSVSGGKNRMRQTIIPSNNETYASLRSSYGSWTMKKMHEYSGISTSGYSTSYRYLPVRDLAKLWVGTFWYFYMDKNSKSKWCRSLYTHGTQSFIYRGMRGKSRVHAKPGWYPGGGKNVQNDSGIVMRTVGGKSRPYVITVMSSACYQHSKLQRLVKLVDAVHSDMVRQGWSY